MGLRYRQSDGSVLDINTGISINSSHIVWDSHEPSVTGCVYYFTLNSKYITNDCSWDGPAICVA